MTDPHNPEPDPLIHPEVQQASTIGYISGYALTVLLLLASLIVTQAHTITGVHLLATLAGLAVFLLIAQALLFFGLDLSRYNIWKTLSLILTIPLFILSIGLTVWMFHSLNAQTMLPEMPGMEMQPTTLQ